MKPLILFCSKSNSSFEKNDELILSEKYRVLTTSQQNKKGIAMVSYLIGQLFFLLSNMHSASLVYIWFADYHAFFPLIFAKLFGKKSILVIGGFDAEKNTEYNYGGHLSYFRSRLIRLCCMLASKLLPVSKFTSSRLSDNTNRCYGSKSEVVYNGVNSAYFASDKEKRNTIVTVCGANSVQRIFIKGVDYFAEVSRAMPHLHFLVIGVEGDAFEYLKSKYKNTNLEILPFLSHDQVAVELGRAKIICQFSRFESFGVSVVEGIFSGCFPIVSNVGGLPEIIESIKFGTVLNTMNTSQIVKVIENAIQNQHQNDDNLKAKEIFGIEQRKNKLYSNIANLFSKI